MAEANGITNLIMKAVKWAGIVVGALVIIIIIAAIALPRFIPLDKVKEIAAQKASEAIHRQVKIGKVSFNIFTGIELSNLSVSNRPGFSNEPFVSAGKIELKYDLWKLLTGKIAVDKVVLLNPEILVEMRSDGTSNYSDLVGVKKPAKPKTETKKKEAISLLVSKFSIVDGKLTLNTFSPEGKKVIQLKDLNLNISGIALVTKKPMSLYARVTGVYEGRPVPITVSGNISLDMNKSTAKASGFSITAAGEKIGFDASVKNFDKAPDAILKISSSGIDTDKFLAIVSGTGTKKKKVPPVYGLMTKNINKSLKSIPANLKLTATVAMQNILFKEMKLDSLALSGKMASKVMNVSLDGLKAYRGTITGKAVMDLNQSGVAYTLSEISGKGFDAAPLSDDVIESFLTKLPDYKELKGKISGTLGFVLSSLTGRGIETPDIIANAKGKGSFILANGKVSRINTLAAIGSKLGLKTLENDIDIKEFKSNFSVANKVVTLSKLDLNNGDKGDLKVAFNGSADIGKMAFVSGNKLSLLLNPKTNQLSAEYEAFKGEDGWYSLDFEMTGALKKPIPIPRLEKPVQNIINTQKKAAEKAVQGEIDKKKQEVEDKANEEIQNKLKELKF